MNVELKADFSEFERQCREATAALAAAIGDSPERAHKARYFLFAGDESLSPGLIEISGVTAPGAGHFTVRFNVSDKIREFTAALAAGEFDGEVIEQASHGASV